MTGHPHEATHFLDSRSTPPARGCATDPSALGRPRQSALWALGLYALGVFTSGALLAPGLHAIVQAAAAHGLAWGRIPQAPFHLYVNRSLLFCALLGLWPLARSAGARRWSDLGWRRDSRDSRLLAQGFAIGFLSLLVVAVLVIAAGARVIECQQSTQGILRHIVNATLAAVVVGFLEETLFRGAILTCVQNALGPAAGLIGSSLVYALVHFFQRPTSPTELHWWSGLAVLGSMLRGFGQPDYLVPGFFNLLVAGLILGLLRQRTGSLWASVGLHSGWILWLKTYGFFTEEVSGASLAFWGTRKLLDGWVALAVLLPLLFVLARKLAPTSEPGHTPTKEWLSR